MHIYYYIQETNMALRRETLCKSHKKRSHREDILCNQSLTGNINKENEKENIA